MYVLLPLFITLYIYNCTWTDIHITPIICVHIFHRLASGETLDSLLVEAFAVVREASWRILELRHYDVQLIGK